MTEVLHMTVDTENEEDRAAMQRGIDDVVEALARFVGPIEKLTPADLARIVAWSIGAAGSIHGKMVTLFSTMNPDKAELMIHGWRHSTAQIAKMISEQTTDAFLRIMNK